MTDSERLLQRVAFELESTRQSLYGDKGENNIMQTSRTNVYDFTTEIDELLCQANSVLSSKEFMKLLDNISMMLADYDYEG